MQTGWSWCCGGGGLETDAETAEVSLNQSFICASPQWPVTNCSPLWCLWSLIWNQFGHLNYNLLKLCQHIWMIVYGTLQKQHLGLPCMFVGLFAKIAFSMCFCFFLPGWRCSETAYQCCFLCCLQHVDTAGSWQCVWPFYVNGNLCFFQTVLVWKGFWVKRILAADATLHVFFLVQPIKL